ncbi:MAG: protein kinase [Lewinellaceae bacterium]|nr:protein kinase [Lewinellaceae bacterium]
MTFQKSTLIDRRYRLISRAGKGGFAEVWQASDTQQGGTKAVKILSPDSGLSDSVVSMALAEHERSKELEHPNILPIEGHGVHDEHYPYLVMPFCHRGSLDTAIQEKRLLDEDQLARLLSQIGGALHYLHTRTPRILHNDIKPGNILIGDSGEYLLTDFGISTQTRVTIQRNSIDRRRMTQALPKSGGKKGQPIEGLAPAYAAPELYGKTPVYSERSDVFSLGVTIYELATGQLPWRGEGGAALLRSGVEVPELPAGFSRRFSQWAEACMHPDPHARPTTEELEQAAQRYLEKGYWEAPPVKVTPRWQTAEAEGDRLFRDGQFREARSKYEEALRLNPAAGSAKEKMERCQEAIRKHKQPEAVAHAEKPTRPSRPAPVRKKRRFNIVANLVSLLILGVIGFAGFIFYREKNFDDHYLKGMQALRQNDYAQASQLLQMAYTYHPGDSGVANLIRFTRFKLVVQEHTKTADSSAIALESNRKDWFKGQSVDKDEAQRRLQDIENRRRKASEGMKTLAAEYQVSTKDVENLSNPYNSLILSSLSQDNRGYCRLTADNGEVSVLRSTIPENFVKNLETCVEGLEKRYNDLVVRVKNE